jgi:hypothetical protein
LILPDAVHARDYCGSFANVLTAYAFLAEIRARIGLFAHGAKKIVD